MKKLLVVLGIASGIHLANAQIPVSKELPARYFNEGKELFLDNNYIGCIHSLSEFKSISDDPKLNMEADYMIVSSMFFQGNKDAEPSLKDFLDTYPETYHRNQICFYIGTIHFDKKEWDKSFYWLQQSDVDYLPHENQDDYSFRLAYTSLQKGNKQLARENFILLNRNSKKYSEPSMYYLAYMDFRDGVYDKPLAVFERLKGKPEYKENSLFFLTQGYFLNNELEKTVSEGESYISSFPNSQNSTEVYRLLGNSYNRLHDMNNSISNYEKYLESQPNPFPEDMYLLGTSYYQIGNYQRAVDVLKFAASTSNLLGQAAFMELGQAYLKLGDTANALMAFDAASRVKYDPATSEAALYNYALLVHQTELSIFGQSITVFQRFLKEYPQSKYRDQIYDILASAFLSTKDYNAALRAMSELSSPGRQIQEAKQVVLFRLGTEAFINNKYNDAINYFNSSINLGNYDVKAKNESHFWLGEIAYRRNQYAEAAKSYSAYIAQASSSDANYALALYNLGYTYFQTKQYSLALSNFLKYVGQEKDHQKPTYADAMNRIGDCYLHDRNFAASEKYYAQAASSTPGKADYADFQKAFVMGMQKNYTGKITALDNMMAKYPDSEYYDDALFEKSRALVMLGRENEAISVLEKLIREVPQSNLNQQAGVQLGQLYFNVNNPNKSIEAYKRVIDTHPATEEARISIKSLESVYKELNDINSYASYVNSLGVGTVVTATRQDTLSYLAAENVYMKGSRSNAKIAMAKYLQSYPNGAFATDAHYFLGYIAFVENDKDLALSEFNHVIKTNNRKYIDDALIYASGIEFERDNFPAAYEAYNMLNRVAATSENKSTAQLGMLRTASLMRKDAEVIEAATLLLNNPKTSPDVAIEARYYKAKSETNLKQVDNAMADYQVLAKDTRNIFGAEAQYILADTYYKWKSYDKAIAQVQTFMKQGTSHNYWMAKSLIVLSDCYAAQGDSFQAKQYLESLKSSYKGKETDIINAINERLNR